MHKTAKTLSALLMSILLLLSLIGCDNAAKKEKAVLETADAFFQSIRSLDMETAGSYTTDAESFTNNTGFKNIQDLQTKMQTQLSSALGASDTLKDAADKFSATFFDLLKNTITYELGEVIAQESDYIVSATITHMDFETDIESLLAKNEDTLNAIAMQVMQSGKVTEQTSQEELMTLLVEAAFTEMMPLVEEAIASAPRITEEVKLQLSKTGNAWRIDIQNSRLPDFSKIKIL